MLYRLLLCLILLPCVALAIADIPLSDPEQEARAKTLFHEFRCVVCQGQALDESNAELAHDLRMLVRERIAAGDTNQQVRLYLSERYGDYILMRPPLKDSTALLWFGPLVILLLGGLGIWRYLSGLSRLNASRSSD